MKYTYNFSEAELATFFINVLSKINLLSIGVKPTPQTIIDREFL